MPRPKAEVVTAVTDEVLAMRWANKNEARMWLKRRGTSPTRLGVAVVDMEDGRVAIRPSGPAAQVASSSSPGDLERFEAYADAVDVRLQDAQEDSADDDRVRRLMLAGFSVDEAAAEIVKERSEALELASAKRKLAAEDAMPAVAKETNAMRVGGAAHVLPADSPPAVSALASDAGARYSVTLGLPATHAEALALAHKASRLLGMVVGVHDMTGLVVDEVAPAPVLPRAGAAVKKDHWPKLAPLLERAEGCTVDEAKAVVGWKTAPGAWFFRKWAEEAGRLDDLVDLGTVNGERTFALRGPPARR